MSQHFLMENKVYPIWHKMTSSNGNSFRVDYWPFVRGMHQRIKMRR